jgi:uncharacterized repeat protein (TIGR01451 family)
MKRRTVPFLLVLAALLALPAAAWAAPAFSVQASHEPVGVARNDESFTYAVKVKNIGDATASAGATLTAAVPAGIRPASFSGSGWSCNFATSTCTSTSTPAAGSEFPTLKLNVWVIPAEAPETVLSTFTAAGGGSTEAASTTDSLTFSAAVPFGLASFSARAEDAAAADYTQAGGHPFSATTAFAVNTRRYPGGENRQVEDLRDLFAELPAGFVGNLASLGAACTVFEVHEFLCPPAAAVGGAAIKLEPSVVGAHTPIYNVIPEQGYAAAFAFMPHGTSTLIVVVRAKLRSNGDYGVTAVAPLAPQAPQPLKAEFVTLCSYGAKVENVPPGSRAIFEGCRHSGETGASEVPFLTNPTRCSGPLLTSARLDSWQRPGATDAEGFPDLADPNWKSSEAAAPAIAGCNHLEFEPSFEGRPTTNLADAPAGLDFHLHIPQPGIKDPEGFASPALRDTTVVLPEGMAVNPAAATGLEACGSAQIGLTTAIGATPVHFTGLPDNCPAAAKLGAVEVFTPLLDKPLHGSLYLARQFDNPFGSLLALYISIHDPETGIVVKLAGKVTPDPVTGQLTTTFEENPQVPFEDLELHVFEGARASLRTPATCGAKATAATFTPWSAPESGPPAQRTDSFQTTTAPGGGACPTDASQLPNAPRFTAGTVTPKAGSYSPFVLRVAREDGSQELKGLNATLPPGLTGRLAGTAQCSEAQIAAAKGRSAPGEGALELAHPSCPASSELGSVDITAGAGPLPFHTTGHAYLAGPYKGAPISMVVITPAVAGPFDLGTVVVRNALYVDPVSTLVSVKSDPIPTILEGIPLDVRSIEVKVSRDRFTLNPTSCEPSQIAATAFGLASNAALTQRFQVGECSSLGFKPSLRIQLHGSTKRARYQRLVATLTARPGDANIARAAVTLPHSEFLAQEHIRTICTRVQFAAHACPQGSIYGFATATTPLLDEPLSGPVYLRSSSHLLPDLVVALRGPDAEPIEVELSGRTDSAHGDIRNTFDVVPDAPVSKFTLRLQGGKKSLIVNSRDLCASRPQRALVHFTAQNGKRRDFQPVVGNDCKKKHRSSKKHRQTKGNMDRLAINSLTANRPR